MLKETDFRWLEKRVNNIPQNPIECEYCIVDLGNGTGKMYIVEPVFAQDPQGYVDQKDGYRYFVFFDCSVKLASEEERTEWFYSGCNYSGYLVTSRSFIAIFDTMEDAKTRAYTQYSHIFGYVLPDVVDNAGELIKEHFVVN